MSPTRWLATAAALALTSGGAARPPATTAPTSAPVTYAPVPAGPPRFLGITIVDDRNVPNAAANGGGGHISIDAVMAGSLGQKLGLQAGDVIRRIDGRAMDSMAEVITAVHDPQPLTMQVTRDGKPVTISE